MPGLISMPTRYMVAVIMSDGRSGSTLIGNLLNESGNAFYAGELLNIWSDIHQRRGRCGCGRTFAECPVWSRVIRRWHPDIETLSDDAWSLGRAHLALFNNRHVPGHLWGRAGTMGPRQATYLSAVRSFFDAIHEVTGASVIVDTSKFPGHAIAVDRATGGSMKTIHLVRDPRGVVASWSAPKEGLPPRGWLHATQRWLIVNSIAASVKAHFKERGMRLRYEDLSADPQATLDRVTSWLGAEPVTLDRHGDRFLLGTNHCASGNPDRMKSGEVRIAPDERWRTDLPARVASTVYLMTLPLLGRFGYLAH